MFSNMRLATKLGLGFGVMILLAAVLGYMGYASQNRVVRRVELADDANRLLKWAKDCRLHEKNYMLTTDIEEQVQAQKLIADINRQIDDTRARFSDPTDIETINGVQQKGATYIAGFDKWVSLRQAQTEEEKVLAQTVSTFIDQCETLREDQEAKLGAEQKYASTETLDRVWKADTANDLIKLSTAARVAQLRYMKGKETIALDQMQTVMKDIYDTCDQLKERMSEAEDKALVDSVRTSAEGYHEGSRQWAGEQDRIDAAKVTLKQTGGTALSKCAQLLEGQSGKLENEIAAGAAKDQLDERLKKIEVATSMNVDIQRSAMVRRDYMISPDPALAEQVNEINARVLEDAAIARAMMKQPADIEEIDQAVEAVKAYVDAFKTYVNGRIRQDEIELGMVASATKFVDACESIAVDQKQRLQDAMDAGQKSVANRIQNTAYANQLIRMAKDCQLQVRNFMLNGDQVYRQQNAETIQSIYATCDTLDGRFKDPENLAQLASLRDGAKKFEDGFSDWARLYNQQQDEEKAMIAAADQFSDGSNTLREGQKNKMAAATQASSRMMLTVSGVAIGLGAFLAFFITRQITKPLNRIMLSLSEGAEQVNDAAGQVSSASQQLAEHASEQASALEESSSALQEMAAMTRTNAENARQANGISSQAREAAEGGDKTMVRLNGAMTAINESSEQISKIIKVIEEIAFQTNLLALNAAVEAARAGEHGKGFAVVADEVRNLAQRAAEAARETTSLIENAVSNAREGSGVANEVGEALGRIVTDVSRVTDLIDGITKASEEQAQGVEQVTTAVGEMDKVTQQNASGAEESAAAAEELAAQAKSVQGIVDELGALVEGARGARQQMQHHAATPVRRPAPVAHKPATTVKSSVQKRPAVSSKASIGSAESTEFDDDFLSMSESNLNEF